MEELARALEDCLKAMERGETDLDALAERHPAAREEIRPLLDVAAALRKRRVRRPPPPELLRRLMERLQGAETGG